MNKKNLILSTVGIILTLTMLSLYFFFKHNSPKFVILFQNYFLFARTQDLMTSFFIFFVLHAPYHIFFLPGYSLLALSAGFYLKNFLLAFLMLLSGNNHNS